MNGTAESGGLPENPLLLIDSAPIIYVLEDHPECAPVFKPVFVAHAERRARFAITTATLAEVLTGPLSENNEGLAERYRATLRFWFVVELDAEVAERARVYAPQRNGSGPTRSRPRVRLRSVRMHWRHTAVIFLHCGICVFLVPDSGGIVSRPP